MAIAIHRIDMRVNEQTKQLAERAAALSGCSVTEYLVRLIQKDAPKVLNGDTHIALSNEQFDHFMRVCEQGKPLSPRIRDVAERLKNEGF